MLYLHRLNPKPDALNPGGAIRNRLKKPEKKTNRDLINPPTKNATTTFPYPYKAQQKCPNDPTWRVLGSYK